MSTTANYLATDGRSLTIDPTVAAGAQKTISTSTRNLTKAERTLKKQQTTLQTLEDQFAAAAPGTPRYKNLQRQINALKPKVEKTQIAVQGFQTKISEANTTLQSGPSVTELYKKADPQTYAAIDRAGEFASKIGQITPQGQSYLDANSAGYQSRDIGQNNITASQIGQIADVSSRDINAARLGQVADIRAQQATASQIGQIADVSSRDIAAARLGPIADIRADQVAAARMGDFGRANATTISAGQVGSGALGNSLMARAQQGIANAGRLTPGAERDAIQASRAGMAARGMATGNSALAAELLNRDRYSRQREFEDLNFAGQVQSADQDRQFQNVGNRLRADQSNQSAALQAEMANLEARYNSAVQQGNWEQAAAISNQTANLRAAEANQQTAFNVESTQSRLNQDADASNRDSSLRAASQNQLTELNRQTSNISEANRITLSNQNADLAAQQSNQSTAFNLNQSNASLAQQASLANQNASLAAATQNQNTSLTLGQSNAQFAQQASLANQDNTFRTDTFNENNRLVGAQQNLSQLGAASNYVDATNKAGFAANVDAANVSATYNPLFRNLGLTQQNIFGTNNLGSLTLGPAAQIGLTTAEMNNNNNQFNNTTQGNVDSFNANQTASTYNTFNTNQTALEASEITSGATKDAGWMSLLGGVAQGGGALGGAAINQYSDRRMKKDIKPLGKGGAGGLLGLTTYEYRYKDGDDKKHVGFMAQDVKKVLPEAVEKVNYKGKTRLAIKPRVIGRRISEILSDSQDAMFEKGYKVGSGLK
jgi:hypothetical protein